MGIHKIAKSSECVRHALGNLSIGKRTSMDVVVYRCVIPCVKVDDPRDVGWVADIHGAGYCRVLAAWSEVSGIEISGERVVKVVGSDKTFDRKSHLFCEQSSGKVAEIPARN